MTPTDRGRLAQIVAYGLSRGDAPAAIDRRLNEYMDLSESEIERAYADAEMGLNVAGEMNALQFSRARAQLKELVQETGALGLVGLAIFRIGEGKDDWRTVKAFVGAGEGEEGLRLALAGRMQEKLRGEYSNLRAMKDRQFTVLYVAQQT